VRLFGLEMVNYEAGGGISQSILSLNLNKTASFGVKSVIGLAGVIEVMSRLEYVMENRSFEGYFFCIL